MSLDTPELDPEISLFARQLSAAWAEYPPFASLPINEARAIAEKVRAPWRASGPVMARTTEHMIPTTTGDLRVRLYDPGLPSPAPLLIYLHGGGFVLFSIDTHDRLMREYAAAGGFAVLGVDYPLSPEARYPKALDQIVDLVEWLNGEGAQSLGIDPERIAIGGDSAGANLSMATALRLRDRGRGDRLKGLLLNYGAFGQACSDEAEARFGGEGAVLQRAEMDHYFTSYLGEDLVHRPDPYAMPILADLRDLPPAFLAIPDCDLLAEQSHEMARRMKDAGVAATPVVYRGATHSFLEAMSVAEVARRAIRDGAEWVKAALER
ncbi:alpha/beta hydrolase fold domain-containing protein [Sphingomonas sp.]|uniref:alpha/beta hydrolase fold domain-containing protein n=1 Tax=Sphingomonas sp. TaxID=28214 RepID=UPI0025EF2F4D|nr:alpha/beta hydrolase fold domain-containing protein [Sphingomonas sp.]MBV9526755.1 alpha/beta hydrolase fold domain-containing protein [Sphingomonas sp.]